MNGEFKEKLYLRLLKFLLVCAVVIAALVVTSAESANLQCSGVFLK